MNTHNNAEIILADVPSKKRFEVCSELCARQPVYTDGSASGVSPELDELLNGEDTSDVFDAATVLGMAAFQLRIGHGVARDPADVGNADNVAVQVGFQDSRTTGGGWILSAEMAFGFVVPYCNIEKLPFIIIISGLDLRRLLQVLGMSVHLSHYSANLVVLHAELISPLLIICSGLIAHWHVLELSLFCEVDVIHGTKACWPMTISEFYVIGQEIIPINRRAPRTEISSSRVKFLWPSGFSFVHPGCQLEWKPTTTSTANLPLGLNLSLICDDIAASRFLFNKLGSIETDLS